MLAPTESSSVKTHHLTESSDTTPAVTANETVEDSNEVFVTAQEVAAATPRSILRRRSSSIEPETVSTGPLMEAEPKQLEQSEVMSPHHELDQRDWNKTHVAAMTPPSWAVFCNLFVLYIAVMSAGLAMHAWYSGSDLNRATSTCASTDCDGLTEFLDSIANLTADPCNDFYDYVCGRATLPLKHLQEASVYVAMNRTLLETPRHIFPRRVRKLVDYYHACYGTLMNPNTVPEDFRDYLIYINISWEAMHNHNASAVLAQLLKLAISRDAVPAIKLSLEDLPVAISHDRPLATILKTALETGSLTMIATAAMGSPVQHHELVDALALDTYEDAEAANLTMRGSETICASQFLGSFPEFLDVFLEVLAEHLKNVSLPQGDCFNSSSPSTIAPNGTVEWDPLLRILDMAILRHNVERLAAARAPVLALYTALCATTELIITETAKRDTYTHNPARTCLDDMRSPVLLDIWNGLVWTSVQPWAKERTLRTLFEMIREQVLKVADETASPRLSATTRGYIQGAAKRMSLAFLESRNDTLGARLPDFHRFRYYRNRDILRLFVNRHKWRHAETPADLAKASVYYNPALYQVQVSLGALVPPLFMADYSPEIQAAGLGFLMTVELVSSVSNRRIWKDGLPSAFVSITHCLLHQAGLQDEDTRFPLFHVANGLRVAALTRSPRPSRQQRRVQQAAMLAEARWRNGRRLFYRMACSAFCSESFDSSILPRHLCHAAVGNSVDFYWLFRCGPDTPMARRGVCALG